MGQAEIGHFNDTIVDQKDVAGSQISIKHLNINFKNNVLELIKIETANKNLKCML